MPGMGAAFSALAALPDCFCASRRSSRTVPLSWNVFACAAPLSADAVSLRSLLVASSCAADPSTRASVGGVAVGVGEGSEVGVGVGEGEDPGSEHPVRETANTSESQTILIAVVPPVGVSRGAMELILHRPPASCHRQASHAPLVPAR